MAKVTYDPQADALYVLLSDLHVKKTATLDDLRNIDYSDDGTVVGVEFIGAKGGVDLSDLPFAPTIEKVIGESGLNIPILAV